MAGRDEFVTILKRFEEYAHIHNSNYSIAKKDAQNWFYNATRSLELNMAQAAQQKGTTKYPRVITHFTQGQMYLFKYEPEGRKKLKHYDRFPLIIVIKSTPTGVLALNLHYLPIMLRISLLNKLVYLLNNRKYTVTTKFLGLSYETLRPFTKYREALPAIKRYTRKFVRSRIVKIFADEWLLASFLPAQEWMKQNESTVYAHSRKRILQSSPGNYGKKTK